MSDKAKHTPGPWVQTLETKYGHDYYNITGADGYQISVVLLKGPVDKANADLQTAAPELLAALKETFDMLIDVLPPGYKMPGQMDTLIRRNEILLHRLR